MSTASNAAGATKRPRRTRREKVVAVIAADMTSAEAASRSTGIPARTIRRWQDDPEMAEYVSKTRDALADDILAVAALAWEHIVRRIRAGNIDTRDLIVAAGVAVDKSQLLSGMATTRTETRDLTGTIPDADIAAAIREAAALVGGSPQPPSDEAEG